jgi:hypothetical protein
MHLVGNPKNGETLRNVALTDQKEHVASFLVGEVFIIHLF